MSQTTIDVGNKKAGESLKIVYDNFFVNTCNVYKNYVKRKEQDNIGIFCGREGRGKTTMANQWAKLMDPTYNESRCLTTSVDLIEALKTAKPFQAFIYDEAQEFTSRAALSRLNRNLVHALSMVRSKRLFIGMAIPNFFELDRYPAMHRSEFLVQVFAHKGDWGFYRFWNWQRKQQLYVKGKKEYNYKAMKFNFQGRFTKEFVIDKDKYQANKDASVLRALEAPQKFQKASMYKNVALTILHEDLKLKLREIKELFAKRGVKWSEETIHEYIKNYRDTSKKDLNTNEPLEIETGEING